MATAIRGGVTYGPASRDKDGHRRYEAIYVVEGTAFDGPASVIETPGLPVYGTEWLVDNDTDLWAFATWEMKVEALGHSAEDADHPHMWKVTVPFSTKPPERYCKTFQIEDPILEPPKINGHAIRYQEEATKDRYGDPIANTAWEKFRGPQVEFDKNRQSIEIEQNIISAFLGYQLPSQMADTVNQFAMWGMPARSIKLSQPSFALKFYGICYPYYCRKLTFDINVVLDQDGNPTSGFDRALLNEGQKVLSGYWDAAHTTGSGCQIRVDTVYKDDPVYPDGAIKAGSVWAGGSNYPPNAKIALPLIAKSTQTGSDAVVAVQTNSGGVVTAIVAWQLGKKDYIVPYGSDYSSQIPNNIYDTGTATGWVLNRNGALPDPSNPAAFIPFTTPDGNRAKVQLNPVGCPICAEEGAYYVSVEKYDESDFSVLGIPMNF